MICILVDAIIFLAPLLFTQTLAEDHAVPRVVDSLQLFSDVVAHPLLARASIVLFLNKLDLAARAIKQGKQISDYLKGYPKDKKENNVGSLVKGILIFVVFCHGRMRTHVIVSIQSKIQDSIQNTFSPT